MIELNPHKKANKAKPNTIQFQPAKKFTISIIEVNHFHSFWTNKTWIFQMVFVPNMKIDKIASKNCELKSFVSNLLDILLGCLIC